MRRGCIVISDIKCDGCGRTGKHPERYLLMSEEGDVETEAEKVLHYCVDCCLEKGYAHYKKAEKGEQILTFRTEEI
ncbi:hypothetical protein ACFLVS_01980 [Chloroflexota bacterium]